MTEWMKKNVITLTVIIMSWVFTIGFVKASTEGRLDRVERDVAEIGSITRRLEINVTKLETIVVRLERMIK
tara:strand:- start:102 stop:314 length:213 start_codon:yes stop_codon:yes gene_type:complete